MLIDQDDTLLGDRFLCRGGGLFLIAPSGMGKSTVTIQAAALWSCGEPAFGISPRGPLRILIIQAEDDQGDVIEMSQMIHRLEDRNGNKLSKRHLDMIDNDTRLIHCPDLFRERVFDALRTELTEAIDNGQPWDLIIINPYTSYLARDAKDPDEAAWFLRQNLTPLLIEFDAGTLIVHHTAKTTFQNTDKFKLWDWMYWGAGCAEISNWARAIIAVKPVSDDMTVFKFVAAKRGRRIGDDWQNAFERYYCHCSIPGVIRWDEATAAQIAEVKPRPAQGSLLIRLLLLNKFRYSMRNSCRQSFKKSRLRAT